MVNPHPFEMRAARGIRRGQDPGAGPVGSGLLEVTITRYRAGTEHSKNDPRLEIKE